MSRQRFQHSSQSFLISGGAHLEYTQYAGVDPPIFLLHEGLGSLSMWRDFPDELARACGRRVIVWSRRGHGWSDPLPGPRDPSYLDREADLIPDIMAGFGVSRAILFGHSDGATIALIAAALHPKLVAAVVVEAPHVFVEQETLRGISATLQSYGSSNLKSKLARHHRDPDQTFFRWSDTWLAPQFREWTIEDLLPSITAPVLMIQGLQDEYGTMEQIIRIETAVPRASRVILPDCGHSPHRERTWPVLAACKDFVSKSKV